jgi:hypothetical protein
VKHLPARVLIVISDLLRSFGIAAAMSQSDEPRRDTVRHKLKGAAITAAVIAAWGSVEPRSPVRRVAEATATAGTGRSRTRHSRRGSDDTKTETREKAEKPITGQALQGAKAVALAATGGGKVTDIDIAGELVLGKATV